ncbi:hypothetical protein BGP89_11315 [Luteimonas sp. JM171]|uniref:hypothetical protein n=1 Tax=Luteimonas sp. JM171 TaxID=1896164 RepID=UPI00085608A2|nr:hypothetical protein [Luteimonas sp. JM171]AOH36869.1 hypothetical protein BGP89_11315 [Luteimonas sp. JM171]
MTADQVPERVTQTGYAQLRGYAKSYVTKLKNQQRLVLDEDGLVLVAQTDAVIAALRDPTRGGDRTGKRRRREAPAAPAAAPATNGQPAGDGELSYTDAARQEKIERTRLLQLEIAEKAGALVPREQVDAEMFRRGRHGVEALMSIKDRLSARLAVESDVHKIEAMLDVELRRVAKIIASGEALAGEVAP